MLFLSEQEMWQSVTLEDVMDAIEDAYAIHKSGNYKMPDRFIAQRDKNMMLYMPCFLDSVIGTKMLSEFPDNPSLGIPYLNGLMILNNAKTGLPKAIMNGSVLTAMRTGAVGGVALRYLAPEDAASVGLVGCGIQGLHQLLYACEVREACRGGIEVDLTISSECFWKLKDRRRSMTGRTGCGICGVESLGEAVREKRVVPHEQTFPMAAYADALGYLERVERLGGITGCTHAAVWVRPDGSFAGGAEDVGRHVALDKLLGLRARRGWRDGALVISSRASYEMVQKAAMCGVEIIFAVSAPTALAVELARECGITLAAFCRRSRANVYSHPERLIGL